MSIFLENVAKAPTQRIFCPIFRKNNESDVKFSIKIENKIENKIKAKRKKRKNVIHPQRVDVCALMCCFFAKPKADDQRSPLRFDKIFMFVRSHKIIANLTATHKTLLTLYGRPLVVRRTLQTPFICVRTNKYNKNETRR